MIDKNFESFGRNVNIDMINNIMADLPKNSEVRLAVILVLYTKKKNMSLYDYLQEINSRTIQIFKDNNEEFNIVHFDRKNIKDGVISVKLGNNKIVSATIEQYIFNLLSEGIAFKNISCIKNEIDAFENKITKKLE